MSKDPVRHAWGTPRQVNSLRTATGQQEQWV
jgi:hypothetical protein